MLVKWCHAAQFGLQVAFPIKFDKDSQGQVTASLGQQIAPEARTDAVAFHHPVSGRRGPLIEVWSHGLRLHVAEMAAAELQARKDNADPQTWSPTDQEQLDACVQYNQLAAAGDMYELLSFVSKNYRALPHNACGPCIMAGVDIGVSNKYVPSCMRCFLFR